MSYNCKEKKISKKEVLSKLNDNYKKIISGYNEELLLANLSSSSIYLRTFCAIIFLYYLQYNNLFLKNITRENVIDFISNYKNYSRFTVKDYLTYTKLFLKFLYSNSYLKEPIHLKVPNIKLPKQSKIPSVWEIKDIEKMLKSIDRTTAIGKRDYAILLLITKLGLRKIDVINLKFKDINWNNKTINIIQHKTANHICLPLVDDIALSLIDYIKYGRPKNDIENIFLTHLKNPTKFSSEHGNFYAIITKYMKKVNIPINREKKNGVHSLRHTLASELLKKSTPIETISSILGHVNSNSTSIYLKIDIEKLRECTLEVLKDEK